MDNQGQNCRNWLDLPDDLTVSILSRLGVIDILETAQWVCKTWHRICVDPTMWRTIEVCGIKILDRYRQSKMWSTVEVWDVKKLDWSWQDKEKKMEAMCRHVVHLSGDNVVNLSLEYFGSDSLLCDITSSSKKIRRLRLVLPNITHNVLLKVAPNLTLLEDLELSYSAYTTEDLEAIGRHCPLLKSLKLNRRHDIDEHRWNAEKLRFVHHHFQVFSCKRSSNRLHDDGDALAIAGTMSCLRQLQMYGNKVTNKGLQALLDGCPCLESLDLRRCFNLEVEGDLKRRCFQGIKKLRLPYDSTNDYELVAADEVVGELYLTFLKVFLREI